MTGGTVSAALALHGLPSYRERLPAPVHHERRRLLPGGRMGASSTALGAQQD
jgi:hypothetical protein